MSTTKDIREMSEVEIEKKLRDTHDAHVHLRLRKQTGQVERPHEFTRAAPRNRAPRNHS